MTDDGGREISSAIDIVHYEESDLDDIMEIELKSFTAPWSRQSYEELAILDSIHVWVAKRKGELVGYMLFQHMADEMELHTFAVKPEYRRKGIGMKLMRHMLFEAARLGANRIYLQVRPSNTSAKKLYKKLGFYTVGIRPDYYHDDHEDALVMRLDLGV